MWSGRRDSDSRPSPWQGDALPTELLPQKNRVVRAKRLELIRLWHQILNLARLPFRHARTLHTTRMALRLPTPKSGRLFIILYAPSLVKAETAIFFLHRYRGCSPAARKQKAGDGGGVRAVRPSP